MGWRCIGTSRRQTRVKRHKTKTHICAESSHLIVQVVRGAVRQSYHGYRAANRRASTYLWFDLWREERENERKFRVSLSNSKRKSKCAGRRLVGAQYKNYVDSTEGGKSRCATRAGRLEVESPWDVSGIGEERARCEMVVGGEGAGGWRWRLKRR